MRIRPLLTLATGALFLVFVSPSLSADDAVELKRHWIVGKKYHRSTQNTTTSTIQTGTATVNTETIMTTEVTETVNPPKEGQGKSLTIRQDRMTMETTMNGKKFHYDSANPDAPDSSKQLASRMSKNVGKETIFLLDDQDIISGLAPNQAYGSSTEQLGTLGKQMIADFMQKSGLHSMPGHPVKPGDSWPFATTSNLPKIGQITINGTYTFKGLSNHDGAPCAEITSTGEMNMDFSKLGPDSAFSKADIKVGNVTIKGTIWLDINLGAIRETETIEEMRMTMKNPANPDMTVTIPMQVKAHTTLTKVEDAP